MKGFAWTTILALTLAGCALKGKLAGSGGGGEGSDESGTGRSGGGAEEWRDDIDPEDARFPGMVVIEAEPGVPKVGDAIAIDWCGLVEEKPGRSHWLKAHLEEAEESGWMFGRQLEVAGLLCLQPEDEQYRRQAAYFVQSWVNMTGQRPEQVVANLKLRLQSEKWEKQRQAHCDTLGVSEEASEIAKELNQAYRDFFGCGRLDVPVWFGRSPSADRDDIVDELDRTLAPSDQMLLAYRVMECAPTYDEIEPGHMLRYAVCRMDARALSEETLEAQMKKSGVNDFAAAVARENHVFARKLARRYEQHAQKMAEKDPAWKKIFAASERAWKEQVATWEQHAKALDAAADYEVKYYGPSRKAARGCAGELRAHFGDHLRSRGAKTVEDLKQTATDQVGGRLLPSLAACEHAEGHGVVAQLYAGMAAEGRATRGPRYAAYYAVLDALATIKADRRRFPVGPEDLFATPWPSLARDVRSAVNQPVEEDKGVVERVRAQGDQVVVSFKEERWREPKYSCRDTNKIWKIEGGEVKYFRSCKRVGSKTVTHTPKPITLPKGYAGGIRPGAFVRFTYDYMDRSAAPSGAVRAVYASKRQKKLISFLGFKL